MLERVTALAWRSDNRALPLEQIGHLKHEFAAVVERVQPDIIHAGPLQKVACLPAFIGFHPLLAMSWGFDLLEDASRSQAWQEATRFVLERSDWFTSDCLTTRDLALQYGMCAERTTIFPWGVNLNLFHPAHDNLRRRKKSDDEDFLVLHTRSWEARYGVDVALEGFWRASQQEPRLRMVMLGGGTQEAMIRGFVKDKQLEDRIHFGGYKQNQALVEDYQTADVYLSASHIDGSSVALMEAMACACPPLVSDIPANLEWVEDGQQGWVFRDGDAHDLAARLVEAAGKRGEAIERGKRARLKAESKADWQKNVQILMRTYEDVWRYHQQRQRK